MAILSSDLIRQGASGATTASYPISQSIRFDVGASPEMSRTHGTGGNTDLFTVSFWFKRGRMTTQVVNDEMHIFGSGADTNNTFDVQFSKTDQIHVWDYHSAYVTRLKTNRQFRDPSAWYHFVFVYDSGQITPNERARLYINGLRETDFEEETYPSQNQNSIVGTNVTIGFGNYISYGSKYFDGYLAEMHYVNGYGYGPENFGEFKENTDIWVPKEFEGNYGSKGFFVDGRDSSDLGDDESGNGNDLSTSGLAAHDQVLDTPTNNWCTINSIYADDASAGNAGTLSEGNLKFVGGGSTFSVRGLTYNLPKSGKWYFEYMIGGSVDGFGYVIEGEQGTINASNGPGQLSVSQGGGIQYHGWRNGGNPTVNFMDGNTGSPFTAGFIHQVAIDVDGGKFYYGVKNTYYAADTGTDGNPSAGTNHIATFAFSTNDVVLLAGNYSGTQYWNFGQDGTFAGQQTAQGNSDANGIGNFYYAVPTGYLALCSSNLGAV